MEVLGLLPRKVHIGTYKQILLIGASEDWKTHSSWKGYGDHCWVVDHS